MSYNTPIGLIIFNRPELTRRVLAEIAKVQPRRLLVAADGPRASHPEDAGKCAATRKLLENLDWKCELLTNFSEVNLGMKRREASGMDWFFQECEEAIILEDDTLPDPTFFPFCDELLKRYRDDEHVSMISGTNLLGSWNKSPHSYFFSTTYSTWGWATWRRAWKHYDLSMKDWPALRDTALFNDPLDSEQSKQRVRRLFDAAYAGRADTWDYQWGFACAKRATLGIVPRANLISNIGYGKNATNTTKTDRFTELPTSKLRFPLSHPDSVERDSAFDYAVNNPKSPFIKRATRRLRRLLQS